MSSQRPRRSLGPPTSAEVTTQREAPFNQQQHFDDCKENINRKTQMKGLQDEIHALQMELLEVRHANIALQSHIRRIQNQGGQMAHEATRKAINQILSLVPALRELQSNLDPSPVQLDIRDIPKINRENFLRNMGMTIATRPASQFAQSLGLTALHEAAELNLEDRIHLNINSHRKRSKGRRSGMGSKAASRSPIPKGLRDVLDPPLGEMSSPSSTNSSPLAQMSPAPVRGVENGRRRRESGLLPASEPQQEEEGEWEEGERVLLSPEDAARILPPATESTMLPLPRMILTTEEDATTDMPVSPMRALSLDEPSSSSASKPSSQSDFSSDTLEEEGGRARRARRSVNYKEPNLHTKMRKPDTMSSTDPRRGSSRSSFAATSLLSPPPSSRAASSEPGPEVIPSMMQALQASVPEGSSKYVTAQFGPMRRKSVLPKSIPRPEEDEDDDDLVDDALGTVEDEVGDQPASLSATLERPTAPPITSNNGLHKSTTVSLLAPAPAPVARSGMSILGVGQTSKPPSASSNRSVSAPRSSPRKNVKMTSKVGPNSRPLVKGNPHIVPLAKRASSIAASALIRDALSDIEENTGPRRGIKDHTHPFVSSKSDARSVSGSRV
ncbi:hypothetical protein TREMEDRAFT_62894 [Tremella mesenterica DSM 1558]|uniref:uncharacterized protein n=1 Tax=Tremella mesenterica (strain ATCC 24925 / CBS 8224 / DSM 1558 / NBRC 9311 / NRRL Y-6157 / RJB 2259-6 / UBC 559-6) TaxID=578456 RepID=UPI0003F48CE4|nr:uncharacterized protein TREMEDRAFT_62894 [Tremella mesenterica DSM 1558]EIW69167.1 hypothetical protein TREMEDRAFT_62894 [Tremella mesenterica DSM 1558]